MNEHDRVKPARLYTDAQVMHERARNQRESATPYEGDAASDLDPAAKMLDRAAAKKIPGQRRRWIFVALTGALVTAAIAGFGLAHKADYSLGFLGSSRAGALLLKSEIATGVLGLALLQLLLALWMWGRLPRMGPGGRIASRMHRVAGIVLILLTLPVAAHCLLAYGVKTSSVRATVHSLAGCFFYGALSTKILVVRSRTLPDWALPIAGGILVATIIVLWYFSALWFLSGYHLPLG